MDDGLEGQAAAVRIAHKSAADAEAISADLLLHDAPLLDVGVLPAVLLPRQIDDDARPLRAALDGMGAVVTIEVEETVECPGVEQNGALGELWPPIACRPPGMAITRCFRRAAAMRSAR